MSFHPRLGAYEVHEEIGKGGMATVYRAYQSNMDRDVAIKVIKSNIIEDPQALERFQQEAKVIARLEHPHILPVYDFDGHNNPPYIVMRYLNGGTLKDVIKQGLLPIAEVAHVVQQIASALDYAHRQGIIHRDIKPSNIMIDRDGNVFVSDLGIARITGGMAGERRGITASGAIVGTAEYMSPEQAMGRGDITHHADIYSLGTMLFEMLTGQLPFDGTSAMQVILKHIQSPVPVPSELNGALPEEIDAVLFKAMAKEADARYETAGQLAHDLLRISGLPDEGPVILRKAAATAVTYRESRPINLETTDPSDNKLTTGSRETPAEQQRQITVIHVNLADFEEILLEVNSEDATGHLSTLMNRIQPVIEQNGGVLRERTDNSIQAMWGVYEIREDDPEVAVATALKIRDIAKTYTLRWIDEEEPSPIQIGVDTGPVLVRQEGDSTMSSSGQPINYAVRVERAAPPGTVMMTYDTFRHVIGVFNVTEETPVRVRGRSEPLEVYVVREARPRAFRLQTRGVEGIETKMIGRDSEFKLLQDAMLLCIEDAETQMVTVTAEAGVGKSRLLYEFSRWLDVIDKTVTFFEGRATQQSTNLPYSLIRSILSFRYEILDSDPIAIMRQKMFKGMVRFLGEDSEEPTAFIGQLVGFDFSDHPSVQPILSNAELFQRRAEAYLSEFFRNIAQKPAVIELEDIHWADHQSLDMINQLVSENQDLPLMIICMARPELAERRPGWGEGQDFHHRLDLKPLSKLDSRRLLREVLQMVDTIPTELRDLIIDRADGNPFYIEELVKILIEDNVIIKGTEEGNEKWTVRIERLNELRVPPTLTGVLQARLDTLDPMARLLLGRASVIGRIFWSSAVEYLHKADGFHIHKINDLLDDLRQREMVFQRESSDIEGTEEYVIKHAILRDVIYESLLKRQQRVYHKAAAEWLIEVSDERSNEYTGLIAEHYELAGEYVKAVGYILTAIRQANTIAAFEEATNLINHALSILPEDNLEDGDDEPEQMRVLVMIEQVNTHFRRWELDHVERIGVRVLELARKINDRTSIAYMLGHLGLNKLRSGQFDDGYTYLNEAETLIDEVDDPRIQIFVLRQIGNIYGTKTQTAEQGLPYLERSLEIAQNTNNVDGEASAYNALANIYNVLGRGEESIEFYQKGVAIAKQTGDDSMLIILLANIGNAYHFLLEFEKAIDYLTQAVTVSKRIGADTHHFRITLAATMVQAGKTEAEILEQLGIGLQGIDTSNNLVVAYESVDAYAQLLTREGQYERGAELIGVLRASSIYDPDDETGSIVFERKALETIGQHLTEDVIQAAIERGKAKDVIVSAIDLYKEINGK